MDGLRRYQQGRYNCRTCGSFDLTVRDRADLPQRYKCPTCGVKATRTALCSGMSKEPQFGVTMPVKYQPDMPGSWYDADGNHRGQKNQGHGGRKRKADQCAECRTAVYASMSGAIYAADAATIRHGKRFEAMPCPHGNGCHVFQTGEA